jgi:hypothetical protein
MHGWMGSPFVRCFLYCLMCVVCQEKILHSYLSRKNFILSFRRGLYPRLQNQWQLIQDRAITCALSDESDEVVWALNKNQKFTTKSLYKFHESDIWPQLYLVMESEDPLKIKKIVWQILWNAMLTRDNMKKRKWPSNPCCYFCNQYENCNHLFFSRVTAKIVWGFRKIHR